MSSSRSSWVDPTDPSQPPQSPISSSSAPAPLLVHADLQLIRFHRRIWHSFIPESNQHTFARGGYYAVDAIPSSLVLISLNTLYFYDSNKAVDGCPAFDKLSVTAELDPGTEELFWLEQQLEIARSRGAQVWLTGHVPPTRANWYDGCYARYGELMLAYHDTIVG